MNETVQTELKKIFKDTGKSSIIGITGPAGAGKSSLINKFYLTKKKSLPRQALSADFRHFLKHA